MTRSNRKAISKVANLISEVERLNALALTNGYASVASEIKATKAQLLEARATANELGLKTA